MAGRRRQRSREGWPDHLYETRGYFYWRNPLTRENFGLGRDFAAAKAQAMEANLHVTGLRDKARLIDRVTGNDTRTVSALLVRYVQDMDKRDLSENTLRTKKSLITRVEAEWGTLPYSQLSTAMIDEFIQGFVGQGKARMAQSFRSFLSEVCNKAIAIGWAQHNPAAVTEAVRVTVKRARLSLGDFLTIYDAAKQHGEQSIVSAMELALVTSQRLEDIAMLTRDMARDGKLWVEQGKTGTRLALPLDLRLTVTAQDGRGIDLRLEDVVRGCWSDNVASRYLIHHTKPRALNKPGDKVWKDTLSRAFTRARKRTSLEWEEGKVPPTFHEIRSLSIRLWAKQVGKDFAQAIAGHKQGSTTDIYTDARGAWVVLKTA